LNGDTIKLVVAIIGLIGGLVALITAIISRRKEVINRQEIVHRHEGAAAPGRQSRSTFICPKCQGDEFSRRTGVYGIWHNLLLFALLVWPFVLLIVLTVNNTGRQPDPAGMIGGLLLYMLPGFIFWRVIRRPYLRCRDCGANVLAKDARAR
jgi:hypothetical protein